MSIYGKRKFLFKTSVKGDKLIVDVLTDNGEFLSFLNNNINNGPYLVRWYRKSKVNLKPLRNMGLNLRFTRRLTHILDF